MTITEVKFRRFINEGNEIEGEILSAYRMELDRQAAEQQDLS